MRWQAVSGAQIVWNRSTRRAGERGGARVRPAQMAEDLDDYRRIFDGSNDLQGAAAIRAVLHVDVEDPVWGGLLRDAVDYLDKLLDKRLKIFETPEVEMPVWRAVSAIGTP